MISERIWAPSEEVFEPNMLDIAYQLSSTDNLGITTSKKDEEFKIRENFQRNNDIPLNSNNVIDNSNNCLVTKDLDSTQDKEIMLPVSKVFCHPIVPFSMYSSRSELFIVVYCPLAVWIF